MCTEGVQVGLQLIINYTGVKQQFCTTAFAVIHASAMSCDNTRILMPNTQYSAAQAWHRCCRLLLSHSYLQISHTQLKQSESATSVNTLFL